MVKVIFYKAVGGSGNGRWADRLIRWWTNGPYSHTEVVTREQDGKSLCWSALPGQGIRSTWLTIDPRDWDVVEVDVDPATVEKWFNDRIGSKYDYVGLLGFVLRTSNYDPSKYFCSECSAASLGIAEPWRYSPNSLKPIIDDLSNYKRK